MRLLYGLRSYFKTIAITIKFKSLPSLLEKDERKQCPFAGKLEGVLVRIGSTSTGVDNLASALKVTGKLLKRWMLWNGTWWAPI